MYRLWERFNSAEFYEDLSDDPHELSLVEAWKRSKGFGVDPRRRNLPVLPEEERQDLFQRSALLLANAKPVVEWSRQFLAGFPGILVLTDGQAAVLHVAGHPEVRERAEEERTLTEGALLPESVAGTNGIGTSLFVKGPVQVCSAEHFCEALQGWTCAAAPILDPFSDGVLGVIDLTFPSDPEATALSIADSLANRITGEIRLQVASERLQLIHLHGEYAARYPSADVLAYDRLGHLIRSSRGAASLPDDEGCVDEITEAVRGPDGGEPIGTLVLIRRRTTRRYSIPLAGS